MSFHSKHILQGTSNTCPTHTSQPTASKPLPVILGRSFPEGTLGPLFPSISLNPYIDANPTISAATLPGGRLPAPLAKRIWTRKPHEQIYLNIGDFDDITTDTKYADMPFKITLDDYCKIKTLWKWDTIVMKNRCDPSVRYLVTHQRSSTPTTMDIQINAYTYDGRCIQPYDSEWPSFILVVNHKLGRRVPQSPAFKKLVTKEQKRKSSTHDDEEHHHQADTCGHWIGKHIIRFILWLNPELRMTTED